MKKSNKLLILACSLAATMSFAVGCNILNSESTSTSGVEESTTSSTPVSVPDSSIVEEIVVATPTLSVNNAVISWTAEEGVTYEYKLNDGEWTVATEMTIDCTAFTETTTVSVRGKIEDVTSEVATQTITVAKLAVPTVTVSEGVATWATTNGDAYQYQVNGGVWVDGTSIQLPTDAGVYTLKVKALGYIDGANIYLASDESEEFKHIIVATPVLSVNNAVVSWTAEEGTTYEYKLNEGEWTTATEASVDCTALTETTVVSVRGKIETVTSEVATQTISVEKLAVPTITVSEGVATWTTTNGNAYQYQVNGGAWVDGASIELPTNAGTYALKVKALGYINGANIYLASDESETQEYTVATTFNVEKDGNLDSVLNVQTNDTFDAIELYINNRKVADNIEADIVDGAYDLATAGYLTGDDYYARVTVIAVKGETKFTSSEFTFEKLTEGVQVAYNGDGSEPTKKGQTKYKGVSVPIDLAKFDDDPYTFEWVNVTMDVKGSISVGADGSVCTGGIHMRAFNFGPGDVRIKSADFHPFDGASSWFAACTATEWTTIQVRVAKDQTVGGLTLVPFSYPGSYPITMYVRNIEIDYSTLSSEQKNPIQKAYNAIGSEIGNKNQAAGSSCISLPIDLTKFDADAATMEWVNVTMKVKGNIAQDANGNTCTGGIYVRAYNFGVGDGRITGADPYIISGASSWFAACTATEWTEITIRVPKNQTVGGLALVPFCYPGTYPITMWAKDIVVDHDTITTSRTNPIQTAYNAIGSEIANKNQAAGSSCISLPIDLTKFDADASTMEWVNVTMKVKGNIAQDANGNTCTGGIYVRAYNFGVGDGRITGADPYIISGADSWFAACTATEWTEITIRVPKNQTVGGLALVPFCYPGTYPITMWAKDIVVDHATISASRVWNPVATSTLTVNNAVISWIAQEGVTYEVKVGEGEWTEVTDTSVDCTAFTATTVVSVRGKMEGYVGEVATQTITVEKLAVPTITVSEGVATWTTTNGNAYQYQVNGGEWVDGASIELPTAVGTYTLKVKALGYINGANIYLASDESEAQEYTVATTFNVEKDGNLDSVLNVQTNDTFDAIELYINNRKVADNIAADIVDGAYDLATAGYLTGDDYYARVTVIAVKGETKFTSLEFTFEKLTEGVQVAYNGDGSEPTKKGQTKYKGVSVPIDLTKFDADPSTMEWVNVTMQVKGSISAGADGSVCTGGIHMRAFNFGPGDIRIKSADYSPFDGVSSWFAACTATEWTTIQVRVAKDQTVGGLTLVPFSYPGSYPITMYVRNIEIDYSTLSSEQKNPIQKAHNAIGSEIANKNQAAGSSCISLPIDLTKFDADASTMEWVNVTMKVKGNIAQDANGNTCTGGIYVRAYNFGVGDGRITGADPYIISGANSWFAACTATEWTEITIRVPKNQTVGGLALVPFCYPGTYPITMWAKDIVVDHATITTTQTNPVKTAHNAKGSEIGNKNQAAGSSGISLPIDLTKFDADASTMEWVNVTMKVKGNIAQDANGNTCTGGIYMRAYNFGVGDGRITGADPYIISGADSWFAACTATEWTEITIRVPKNQTVGGLVLVPFCYPGSYAITMHAMDIVVDHSTISTSRTWTAA